MQDNRVHPRVPIDVTMTCEAADGTHFEALAKDVSVGGMFLTSGTAPAFGTELTIVGRLPGTKKDVKLPAIVRWVKPGGFGVQFGLLGAVETHVLSELMRID